MSVNVGDTWVLYSQRYLNAMFGGHPDWVQLEENGYTGTETLQGIIRAFQINNNVGGVTGSVGPLTIAKMKQLANISKMDPNSDGTINVCLIQCALFCKGYNAGGITGVYYNAGVAAVKELQRDAGLEETGIIDWKIWRALLSLNWFKLTVLGNSTVRRIQQQLNSDYSDVIGVGPCDGEVSRQTILSLVGALQAEEGVTTELIINLNEVNFGPATTANFPGVLRKDNDETYIPYNKIAQYGLYFNGYNPGNFDGIFNSTMRDAVIEFQEFYGLFGIGLVNQGEVNVSTMKSLLTSKGDTDRRALACDCATVLNNAQAGSLYVAGYRYVGRYLNGYVGSSTRKYITFDEIDAIRNANLNLFPIYQNGGYYLEYFMDADQGLFDGYSAISTAKLIGIPDNTTIYFAVDFDCYAYQISEFIIPYFRNINKIFEGSENTKNYKVGIYGPRYVCKRVSDLEYSVYSFVSDMSTGYSCNLGYSLPDNWAFDQFWGATILSESSFEIDKDAFSGRDTGVSQFDTVPRLTIEQMDYKHAEIKLLNKKRQFVYNVADTFNAKEQYINGGITLGEERLINIVNTGAYTLALTAKLESKFEDHSEKEYSFDIIVDEHGNISSECENNIMAIANEFEYEDLDYSDGIYNIFTNLAISIKKGNVTLQVAYMNAKSAKFSIIVESDDLLPDSPCLNHEIAVVLTFQITLNDDSNHFFDLSKQMEMVLTGGTVALVIISLLNPAVELLTILLRTGILVIL